MVDPPYSILRTRSIVKHERDRTVRLCCPVALVYPRITTSHIRAGWA